MNVFLKCLNPIRNQRRQSWSLRQSRTLEYDIWSRLISLSIENYVKNIVQDACFTKFTVGVYPVLHSVINVFLIVVIIVVVVIIIILQA